MSRTRCILILAYLAALPAAVFSLYGYAGDDFWIHIASWMDLRHAWSQGSLLPGWAAHANYTLGDPRFCFYPPLSFWIGAGLSSLLPFRIAPGVFSWLALFLGGISMFLACKSVVAADPATDSGQFSGNNRRLAAAVLYMVGPYFLLTAIDRFAAAELLSLAWLPFIVVDAFEILYTRDRSHWWRFALLYGLTWLTNVPAALVIAYTLFPLAFVAAVRRRSFAPLLHCLIAAGLALALAAFYILPALVEQPWIAASNLFRFDYHRYFLLVPLSLLPRRLFGVSCWIFAALEMALILASCFRMRMDSVRRFLLEVGAVAFCFQLSVTSVLWEHLPKLSFVVFPWRFLAPMAVALPLLLLAPDTRRRLVGPAIFAVSLLAFTAFSGYFVPGFTFHWGPFAQLTANLERGYPGLQEYLPAGAHPPVQADALVAVAAADRNLGGSCPADLLSQDLPRRAFSTDGSQLCSFRLALLYYPDWHATDEAGDNLPVRPDSKGLMLITVPAGRHTVHLTFAPADRPRIAGAVVSLGAAILIGLGSLGRLRTPRAIRSMEAIRESRS